MNIWPYKIQIPKSGVQLRTAGQLMGNPPTKNPFNERCSSILHQLHDQPTSEWGEWPPPQLPLSLLGVFTISPPNTQSTRNSSRPAIIPWVGCIQHDCRETRIVFEWHRRFSSSGHSVLDLLSVSWSDYANIGWRSSNASTLNRRL